MDSFKPVTRWGPLLNAWLLVLLVMLAAPWVAEAKFAESQGFSGRHGVTCQSCHVQTPGGLVPPAEAAIEGLPVAYQAGAQYRFTVSVRGGPDASPLPTQPQGGFDVEVDAGTLEAGAGMEGRLRFPKPNEATYTGEGTLRRTWSLVWHAPEVSQRPTNVTFWAAVLAANGNHLMGGPDSAGERGDAAATVRLTVPPTEGTRQAWSLRPVPPPRIDPPAAWPASGMPLVIHGAVDEDSDGAEWRLDGGSWDGAIGAPAFIVSLTVPPPGAHVLEARAVRGTASSDPVLLEFRILDDGGPARIDGEPAAGPAWGLLLLAPLAPAVWMLWRSRR